MYLKQNACLQTFNQENFIIIIYFIIGRHNVHITIM